MVDSLQAEGCLPLAEAHSTNWSLPLLDIEVRGKKGANLYYLSQPILYAFLLHYYYKHM